MDARAPGFEYPTPWGYLATFGWVVLALAISAISAIAVSVCYFFWPHGNLHYAINTPYDGTLLTIGSIVSTPVQIAILAYAAHLKRWAITDYLALVLPRASDAIRAVALLVVLVIVLEGALYLLGQDLVPVFQIDAYRTAKASGWLPPLFLAIVIFAPVGEEIMFRGFMYRGFVRRPGHEPYAIVVLALAWTGLHVQYDWVGLLQVFIIGLYLGWVRWSTGSTLLTMLLHVLMNFEAMMETVIRVEGLNS